ncbi:MAG: ABC transporter substrate-binding protein [Planctomycetota bacterium]|nr:ABC transporter substrate-binding protein [Planctomycetota bacterium]
MKGATRAIVCAFVFALVAGPVITRADPLTIAYSDWPGYVAWEVALQKGFFKDAGVDVKFIWFDYGPSIDAFAAGKVDAVTIVSGDAVVTGAGGKPSAAILLEDYSNGNDMIIGKPGIDSIKDLKGKKVGVEYGLVEHELLMKAMETNGMSETDVNIVKVSTNDTPQTLASGSVDAVGAWYPISGHALKNVAGSKPLFTSANVPGLIYDELAVSRESLAAHRDDWKKVVGVWFKTVDFINDPKTHDEAVKIMAAKVSVPAEEYQKSLGGTALLGANENLKALQKNDTLQSVYGSLKIADGFYTKYAVYKDSQDPKKYIYPALVEEVTGKKPDDAK